jgi:23S rRNA (cytosine1962-C5)-methyltransferase
MVSIGLREQDAFTHPDSSSGEGCRNRGPPDATLADDEEETMVQKVFHGDETACAIKLVKGIAGGMESNAYNASMSRKPPTIVSKEKSDRDDSKDSGVAGVRDSAAKVVLRRGRARPLWFGHPWVYANAVDRVEGKAEPGCVVSLVDHDGRFIGRGIYNSRSQIPVRLLSRSEEPIDAAFILRRLREAQALRATIALPSVETTAYRLVNSEGDELPGLVVDVFGDAVAFQVTTLGMSLWRDEIVQALGELLAPKTVYEVSAGSFAEVEGFVSESRIVAGEPRISVSCLEDGIRLAVEPLVGQKTGLFLDQRPSRIRVGQIVRSSSRKPMRVLDCYAYAGGFSLQAARAGAGEITAVDSSSRAVARIEAHAAANGAAIRAVESDTFRFLETATPRAYDLVVIDPPKFARARKDLEAALKGYERLNALALTACAPGAVLVTCSCSQNVSGEDFERILAAGARQANREMRILDRLGPGPDHPLPPGFGEGQYLKVLLAYVK